MELPSLAVVKNSLMIIQQRLVIEKAHALALVSLMETIADAFEPE